MKTAGFETKEGNLQQRLQASLYYARKRRIARLKAQKKKQAQR